MLSNGSLSCTYDSANRLLTAGGNTYTYNAEDVRIKNVHYGVEEKYTYDTVAELSRLLTRTVGSNVTKYVYGLGLISEETNNTVKVYHFDYRGSTVAITDVNGNISDTFAYDTYGKITSRVGNSDIIFCYNGILGVVTDNNNLVYMRARYYSPEMRRFVNADIIAGEISEAITLNRYAYANSNPVSNVDPLGLWAVFDWIKNTCIDIKKWFSNLENSLIKDIFNQSVDLFKKETASGNVDWFLALTLGITKDDVDIYHISQSYWQSIHFVGYNDLYDVAFDFGVGMTGYTVDHEKFPFKLKNGQEFVIWLWKGDYINLGSGAEVGIYKKSIISGHWLTGTDYAMPMTLKLVEIDTGKILFDYRPLEKQWWINGFDPSNQNVYANNLQLTVTIDFSEYKELFKSFKETYENDWSFVDMTATYSW